MLSSCTIRFNGRGRRFVNIVANPIATVRSQISCTEQFALGIPMANGVESLNVAVTGALVAFQMVRSVK